MSTPEDPRLEAALRASLAEHARRSPAGEGLAERIILSAGDERLPSVRPSRRWGTWSLPLIAAAAVAVVAGIVIGVNHLNRPSAGAPLPAISTPVPAPDSAPISSPVISSSVTESAAPQTAQVTVIGLTHFRVDDATFVGVDDGWALGTADCLLKPGTCVAMVHTTDGKTWNAVTNPPVNLAGITDGCTSPCATNIRFATDQIGYVFGPSALFMTTDGGASWTKQSGGAYALETLDGNVIRVGTQCVPGCPFTAQIAPIGSAQWQTVALPAPQAATSVGASLSRTGSSAFVVIYGHTDGGAQDATSVLYSSLDDGAAWTRRGEVCPQIGGGQLGSEVDTTALTTASDGSVTVLCTPRGQPSAQFTETSTDGGASFHQGLATALSGAPVSAIGAASAQILLVADGQTLRSTNGGQSFTALGSDGRPSPGNAKWIGFENATVGRAISSDGSTIWTTRDAGQTWTSHTFP